MSQTDSKDDEVKSLLDSIGSDDSKESNIKKVKKEYKNDEYNDYDISDDKELDDSDW